MRTRWILVLAATAATATLGGLAATGIGDDEPERVTPAGFEIVRPELGPVRGDSASALLRAKGKAKPPAVTHLITTSPVPVGPDDELVAELVCKRSQGVPVGGGAIAPPAPAQVAVSVDSRFSPNPPYSAEPGSYYVGVRNFDPVNPSEFRATVVCAKGVKEAS